MPQVHTGLLGGLLQGDQISFPFPGNLHNLRTFIGCFLLPAFGKVPIEGTMRASHWPDTAFLFLCSRGRGIWPELGQQSPPL